MTKLYKAIVAELRKLNVTLVYASLDRIIISATGKQSLEAAQEYIQFIVATLKNADMFSELEVMCACSGIFFLCARQMTPIHFWSQLVWLDKHNWSAIRLLDTDSHQKVQHVSILDSNELETASSVGEETSNAKDDEYGFLSNLLSDEESGSILPDKENEEIGKDTEKLGIDSMDAEEEDNDPVIHHWSMVSYLPHPVILLFNHVISEYLLKGFQAIQTQEVTNYNFITLFLCFNYS